MERRDDERGAVSARTRAGVRARFAQIAFVFTLQGLILFAGAGNLWWVWAWGVLGICTAGLAVNATNLLRRSPELVAERGRPGRMRGWDIALCTARSVASYIALPLVAGLDARWGWTSGMGLGWQAARARRPAVPLADDRLKGISGRGALAQIRARWHRVGALRS